jgi:membrane-bound serine protease (ClpP class)
VVLRLDTPGGFDSSMRDIIKRMQASSVPVIVYVAPSGGRAASAGTFITMAGHVAAMAPGTTIGAASPIDSSGKDIEGTLGRKVMNDAVAYIRALATQHGRNADWAEKAVRDAVAVSQDEAVKLHVVDFEATSLDGLLKQSDGRQVDVAQPGGGTASVTMRTAGAPIYDNDRTFFEEILYRLADPNIAFLLLSLGGLALLIELFHPTFIGAIIGITSLIFAYFALGAIEANWAGAALVLFGIILLGMEAFIVSHGVLGVGGIIALALGGLILTSGSETGVSVSRWLIVAMVAFAVAWVFLFLTALLKLRHMSRERPTRASMVGEHGVARTSLDPRGVVLIEGERWDATIEADDEPIEPDTRVVVTAVSGLRLKVRREAGVPPQTAPGSLTPA